MPRFDWISPQHFAGPLAALIVLFLLSHESDLRGESFNRIVVGKTIQSAAPASILERTSPPASARPVGAVTAAVKNAAAPATEFDRHLLRLQAMSLIAVSEGRTADAEALIAAIEALEATRNAGGLTPSQAAPRLTKRPYVPDKAEVVFRPALFRGYESIAVRLKVTGTATGSVWGSDVYTDDSSIGKAAVHAGLVKNGETKDLVLITEPGRDSYDSSERNGIKTSSYGSWNGSFRLTTVEERPDAAYFVSIDTPLGNQHSLASLDQLTTEIPRTPGTILLIQVHGTTEGRLWGTDTYTADSSLNMAAVHAGIVKPGESAWCKLTIAKGQQEYQGSERNGVKSRPYGSWALSYQLEALTKSTTKPQQAQRRYF